MGHQKSPDFGESELRSVLMLRAWIERVWGGASGRAEWWQEKPWKWPIISSFFSFSPFFFQCYLVLLFTSPPKNKQTKNINIINIISEINPFGYVRQFSTIFSGCCTVFFLYPEYMMEPIEHVCMSAPLSEKCFNSHIGRKWSSNFLSSCRK